jgi:hypothetical protein
LIDPPATPRRLAAGEEESAVRRLDCRSYTACLGVAAKARWASWCCGGCGAFAATPRAAPALRHSSNLSSGE